ncbi:MAG: type II CAAX endopeptidase family protein [Longimicrobiales bacterium]|nr:type II CAAX endopeptidase family protein [Longimicrobiales bacterium]
MIRVPQPTAAVFFVAGVAVLFVSGGSALGLWLDEGWLPAAEWLFVFLPAIAFVRLGGYDLGDTLSLRRPTARGLAGAVLLGIGATPVAWAIGWAQGLVAPPPPGFVEAMVALATAHTPGRLAWLLFAVAVTPAICEEVVFRGVLLSATRRLETWRVLALNGVVFGAFHFSFQTSIRFLPTAWLGIVIAWAVLRTGSIWAGVLMHLLNNGTIVLLASAPALSWLVTDPDPPPPLWLLSLGALSLVAGARVLGNEPARAEVAGALPHREEP